MNSTKTPRENQTTSYIYRSATGEPLYRVIRIPGKAGFPQERWGGDGWISGKGCMDGVQRVLYMLPELMAATDRKPVIIPEGEKDTDNLAAMGFVATTSSGGAGKWAQTDSEPLRGRLCIVLPDNDDPGRDHARDICHDLAGKAADVRVLTLPGLEHKQDISDWIEQRRAEGKGDEVIAQELRDLIATAAIPWTEPEKVTDKRTGDAPIVLQYKPFPTAMLPEPIKSFVEQGAKAMGCDESFVALPTLTALASAIGNTRRLELKRGWSEPPIVWAAIIGESGTLKSPALEQALRPIRHKQQRAFDEYARRLESYENDKLHYDKDLAAWRKSKDGGEPPQEPEKPIAERFIFDDVTIEAVGILLLRQPRGLLAARDELAGWFGSFSEYKKSKGSDSSKWLEMWGGRSVTIDRKTGIPPTVYIPRAAVSITGGIQPGTLRRELRPEHFENGLAARLLLAAPPRKRRTWTEADIPVRLAERMAGVFDLLFSLEPESDDDGNPRPSLVKLDDDAKRAWVEFVNAHGAEQLEHEGPLAAVWSKLEAYAARFALVLQMTRWAAGDPTARASQVDAQSMAAGVQLAKWFGREAVRIYNIFSEDADAGHNRELAELIHQRGGEITIRDLCRGPRQYRGQTEKAKADLDALEAAGVGQWTYPPPGPAGGNPSPVFVLNQSGDTGDGDTTPDCDSASGGSVTVATVAAGDNEKTPDADFVEI